VQSRAHNDVALDEIAGATHICYRGAVAKRSRTLAHVIEGTKSHIEKLLLLGDLTLVRHE
jgi:hypothetical protein